MTPEAEVRRTDQLWECCGRTGAGAPARAVRVRGAPALTLSWGGPRAVRPNSRCNPCAG